MMRILLLAALLITGIASQAQTGKVTVTVWNGQQALENATVELLQVKDSALVKTALTNKTGEAELETVKHDSYLVRVSMVGFQPAYSDSFHTSATTPSFQLKQIAMQPSKSNQLQGVTVTSKKPFIQKLSDRIVVNVENSVVSAGSSALDVLERSPGVTVDQNDAISLRGRAGVIIMIDGKPSPMSGAELANYLKGLPSNAIERIEIITNPSAKYDAAGNSGIIDIRMKKDQRLGANGTLNLGIGHGELPKANAGASLNYRNKKLNVFGNYNFGYRENLNNLIINRNFFKNGVFKGSDDKDNYAEFPVTNHTVRTGIDFFPSKNTIIGAVVSSNFTAVDREAKILTTVNDTKNIAESIIRSSGSDDNNYDNTVANLNLKHKFDSVGRELAVDVDYGVFNSQSYTRTASEFFNIDGSKKRDDDVLDGDQTGKLILRTAKADYANPLKKGARFETGYKTSYVSSDNDAKFYKVLGSGTVVDEAKTNRFYYKEYNNAGYVNYSKEFKKFNLQMGLRGEHTRLKTKQVKNDERFERNYFELFPSAYFNYKLSGDKTVGVSVSRRIDRPGYNQLNPFLFQIDPGIYSTGDPNLKPQMTWSYEASYTLKNLNFTLGYSRTKDPQSTVLSPILEVMPDFVIEPGTDSNITVQIPVNLRSSDYIGLTATAPIRINAWWNMINNFNLYYNHYNGDLAGVQLSNGTPAANIRTNNTFTFKKGWTTELNADLNTGGRMGYMVMDPRWGLSTGVQKTVMKSKGTLRLNVTDIFWTNLPKATVTYEGVYVENWKAYRDTRVANLSFTYRFGNNKVQAARRRTTASEEERQRAGGN